VTAESRPNTNTAWAVRRCGHLGKLRYPILNGASNLVASWENMVVRVKVWVDL
jgi:hypothetical protein